MNKYSVMFLRPEYFWDNRQETPYGKDTYIAEVEAKTSQEAIDIGREELFRADASEDVNEGLKIKREDYKVLMVFHGYPKVAVYGWQTEE